MIDGDGHAHLFSGELDGLADVCVRCNISLGEWVEELNLPSDDQPMLPFDEADDGPADE